MRGACAGAKDDAAAGGRVDADSTRAIDGGGPGGGPGGRGGGPGVCIITRSGACTDGERCATGSIPGKQLASRVCRRAATARSSACFFDPVGNASSRVT